MKRTVRYAALLLALLTALCAVSGCWGYHDVDELFIVMGGYLDEDYDTKQFTVYAEILKPQGSEGEMERQVVSGKGDTIFAAIRDSITELGGRLYWGHTQVWVISRNAADNGILPALDMFSRGTEVRTDTNVLIYDGDSVRELAEALGQDDLHNSMAQHINDTVQNYQRSGFFVDTPIWKVLGEISGEGISMTLPLLETYLDGDKTQIDVKGIAVFREDRIIGYIDREYGKFLYGYKGNLKKEYLLYLPEMNDFPATSLEVSNTDYSTKIIQTQQGIKAEIRCEIEANLSSYQTEQDYFTTGGIELIEREYERHIREEFLQMVDEVQSRFGVDIFGFGRHVHIQQQEYWAKVKGDWNAAFRDLEVEIEPRVRITMTGLAHEPIDVAGGE
jgi:spore germination protein KC